MGQICGNGEGRGLPIYLILALIAFCHDLPQDVLMCFLCHTIETYPSIIDSTVLTTF